MPENDLLHWHGHSSFSQLDGVGSCDHHAEVALRLGHAALGISDHGNINGALAHRKACEKRGLIPVVGMESYWRPDRLTRDKELRYKRWHLILIAKNLTGWHNLIRISSAAFADGFYQNPCIDFDLQERFGEGLICTTSCVSGPLSYLVQNGSDREIRDWIEQALKIHGGDLYFSIMPHNFDWQREYNLAVVSLAREFGVPLLHEKDRHYPEKGWVETQKIAILCGMNKTFAQADEEARKRAAEGKDEYELWHDDLHLSSEEEDRAMYAAHHPDLPQDAVDEAMRNTDDLLDKIEPYLMDRSLKMPRTLKGQDPREKVLEWCREGMKRIGKEGDPVYEERLRYETEVVDGQRAWSLLYFVGDVVRWARSDAPLPLPLSGDMLPVMEFQDYAERKRPIRLNSGRGSAAASIICYLSQITMIDPIAHKFKFERFMNPERKSIPDIDIDVASTKRNVLKEYVARRYGRESVADVVAQQTWQPRAALLNVTKTMYGYDSEAYKMVAKLTHEDTGVIDPVHDTDLEEIREREADLDAWAEKFPVAWEHARRLENAGDPSILRLSKHAGAVAVLPGKVTDVIPTIRASEEEVGQRTAWAETARISIQEELGIVKADFLSLKGMDQQQMIVDMIAAHTGEIVDLDSLPPLRDPYDIEPSVMETITKYRLGINQLQSDGIGDFVRRVAPENLVDLTAINALYRPGPLGSGAHNRFVKRKRGEEDVEYPEILHPILADTHFTISFQEQVMGLFEALVGYTPGQADDIRKIIAKLYRDKGGLAEEKMAEHRERFIAGATAKIGEEWAERLWEEILPFTAYCLSGDTVVLRGAAGKHCGLETTLRDLSDAWKSRSHVGQKLRRSGVRLLALDSDGRVRPAKAKRVWSNGIRQVFEVRTESGKSLRGTSNHRLLTTSGYRVISELSVGDELMIMGQDLKIHKGPAPVRGRGTSYDSGGTPGVPEGEGNPGWVDGRKALLVRAKVTVADRSGGRCEECRRSGDGEKHSLEFAHQIPLDVLRGSYEMYHSPHNIKHLCNSCHKTLDYMKGERKRRWSRGRPTVVDPVVSIAAAGQEEVFDVEMDSGEHNFVANGIISHNSFNRPHAGSYMIQGYQDGWLKDHYPLFSYAVLLTLEEKKAQLIFREARAFGVSVLPPDINVSGDGFSVDFEENAVRYGLRGIKGIGDAVAKQVLADRPYASLYDFQQRSSRKYSKVNKKAREILARVGALDRYGVRDDGNVAWETEDGEVLWDARLRARCEKELLGVTLEPGGVLGDDAAIVRENVHTEQEVADLSEDSRVVVGGFPSDLRKTKVKRGRQAGREMAFAKLTLDLDEYSLTLFPDSWDSCREMIESGEPLMVRGRRDASGKVIVADAMLLQAFVAEMHGQERIAA